MRLVLVATSANQSYIFASNRLREAVGASELVRLSTTRWMHDVLTASEPGRAHVTDTTATATTATAVSHADVIQESSGNALLVVNGPAGGSEPARRIVNELTRRVMREAPGLDIAGVSLPIAGPTRTPGCCLRKLSRSGGRGPTPTAGCASRPACPW